MTDAAAAQPTDEAADKAAEPVDATAAATEGGAAEAAATPEPVQAETPAAVRPEQLPDEYWDTDKGAVKVADLLKAHLDLKAEVEAGRADVPENAEGYEIKVSDAVTLPDGYKLDIDADSPFAKEVRDWAVANKLPRAAWQGLLDAEARRQIAEQNVAVEGFVSAKTALGENADKRIEAALNWVSANVSSKAAQALMGAVGPAAIPALEEIIALRSGPQAPGGVSAPAQGERKFGDGWFKSMPAKS